LENQSYVKTSLKKEFLANNNVQLSVA